MKNFHFPYFSRDVAEFWRRWHISLNTWFRDYLYIPLGGSRGGNYMRIRNTFIIFLVSGFWHGANWTFIVWGGLNALFIMPAIIFKTNRNNMDIVAKGRLLPSFKDVLNIIITFLLVAFAWIFFRAENLEHAFNYISGIFSKSLFSVPGMNKAALATLILIAFLLFIEWLGRENNYGIEKLFLSDTHKESKLWTFFRWSFYAFIILLIGLFMQLEETPFIYFQF